MNDLARKLQVINRTWNDVSAIEAADETKLSLEFEEDVSSQALQSMVFVDIAWKPELMEKFLHSRPISPLLGTCVTFFYSDPSLVKRLLLNLGCADALQDERLRFVSMGKAEDYLERAFENPRTMLIANEHVLGKKGDRGYELIQQLISDYKQRYLDQVKKAREYLQTYYQSEAYEERLKAIKAGARPRIYVCRTCHSFSVRNFSNECARVFKQLECETFIHETCKVHEMDYKSTEILEMKEFLPDFYIDAPNSFTHFFKGLRCLLSFQDLLPFQQFCDGLEGSLESLAKTLIYVPYKKFELELLKRGVHQNNIICKPIHTDEFKLSSYKPDEQKPYEIGLVKSLPQSLRLENFVEQNLNIKLASEQERKFIAELESTLLEYVHRDQLLSDEAFLKLGQSPALANILVVYFHNCLCVHYAQSLAKQGFKLALVGDHWESVEYCAPYAKGKLVDRSAYYSFFDDCKINLSVNANLEMHHRIMEGAQVSAFMMLKKVPEAIGLSSMPEDFVEGQHFEYFESAEELVEQCKLQLGRVAHRKQCGGQLHQLVRSNYTYRRLCSDFKNAWLFLID